MLYSKQLQKAVRIVFCKLESRSQCGHKVNQSSANIGVDNAADALRLECTKKK